MQNLQIGVRSESAIEDLLISIFYSKVLVRYNYKTTRKSHQTSICMDIELRQPHHEENRRAG